MKIIGDQMWCGSGECPCPVWEYVKRQNSYFPAEQAADELMLPLKRIRMCLKNLSDFSAVCNDGVLWGLEYPYR